MQGVLFSVYSATFKQVISGCISAQISEVERMSESCVW